MRALIILIGISVSCLSSSLAQSLTEQRSSILYVIGRVSSADKTSCIIDVGAVHTIASQDQLAVFRPVRGHFQPIGRIRVTRVEPTTSHCINHVRSMPNDIVMVVREISELYPGARHRERVVRQQVVRSYRMTSFSTINNVRTAMALSDYELQFPEWERSRGDIAGTFFSDSMQESADESLRRLRSQINMMRRLYQQDAQMVAAAGDIWSNIMPLVAGETAEAGHALQLKDLHDGDVSEDRVQFSAVELRRRVLDRIYQLQPEQQNVVALIVASLMSGSSRDATLFLRTAINQTQFPDLDDDEQFMEDLGQLVLDIRDGD